MSKHFCCCIPVRAAVFFFSLLNFLGAGASAGLGWFVVYEIENDKLDTLEKNLTDAQKQTFEDFLQKYKWGFIVVSAVFTIIAILSLFGFIGSIIRNRRMVKAYSYMTIVIFVLGTATAGFMLYLIWSNKQICSTDSGEEVCISATANTGGKIIYTVGTIIEWLIELYIVVIIRRYYEQLEEEREYRHEYRLNPTANGTYEAKDGLLAENHYPYTDNSNAFGSQSHA